MGFKFVGPCYVFEAIGNLEDCERFNIRSTFRVSKKVESLLLQHHDLQNVPEAYNMLHKYHRINACADGTTYIARLITLRDSEMISESEGETGCEDE